MCTFEVGDRVISLRKGCEGDVGTVNRVDDDGTPFVTWDGHWADYQESNHTIAPVDPHAACNDKIRSLTEQVDALTNQNADLSGQLQDAEAHTAA